MASKPIQIDLRRDLPKVRENWAKLMKALPKESCLYSAPCVIGAMFDEAARDRLRRNRTLNERTIANLLDREVVKAPAGQRDDLVRLQSAFDSGDLTQFEAELSCVEAKYLAA